MLTPQKAMLDLSQIIAKIYCKAKEVLIQNGGELFPEIHAG